MSFQATRKKGEETIYAESFSGSISGHNFPFGIVGKQKELAFRDTKMHGLKGISDGN